MISDTKNEKIDSGIPSAIILPFRQEHEDLPESSVSPRVKKPDNPYSQEKLKASLEKALSENNIPSNAQLIDSFIKAVRIEAAKNDPNSISSNFYFPLPEEVPEGWKWKAFKLDDWEELSKRVQSIKKPEEATRILKIQKSIILKYLHNSDGFGRFVQAGVLDQNQLHELDGEGHYEVKKFSKRPAVKSRKLFSLAEIVPTRSVRVRKEFIPVKELDLTNISALDYIRLRSMEGILSKEKNTKETNSV